MAGGGGLTPSSATSGIFFQGGEDESQGFMNSHFTSSNSLPGCGGGVYHPNLSEMHNNPGGMMSVSTPGASSMVTDANSGGGISGGGPHLQRSASINNESYMRLPASPLSFSSSSVADGSTVVQRPPPHHDPGGVQRGGGGSSCATSRRGASEGFFQDPTQARKKARVDSKQDDALQQQILRQWLQRQELLHQQQQGQNPQLQLLLQQQKMRQQQQFLQSLPPLQRIQLQQQQQVQQQQQQQLQQMQQQVSGGQRVYENSVCARRLMQYLYHQRQRPSEGSIVYWRKFVNEYFSPRAKKRWCLSHYDNVGHNTLGVSPQAATDEWQCDLCGSKSGRGFEATFDVLPRLNEIKFASGVIDELLYLSVPSERRFPSGIMVLEYAKAVQESVYEHIRVVREGHLRIIFSQELKILSWEFCTRRHEELLPRRLVAPQVNQLLQVAEKCQSTIDQSGPDGIHQQDLQANSNMVMAAGRQLAKSLESHSLNDLGFSKRYVRCLQISEVVSSMKDMIDLCRDQKVGPIEALKSYPYRMKTGKMQMQQEMEQAANDARGLPPDRNSLNKLMALRSNNMNGHGSLPGSAQAAAFALTNYQTMLMKQNHPEPTSGAFQQEPSRNMSPSPSYNGAGPLLTGFAQSPSISGVSSPQRQMPSSSYNSSAHQQYQQQASCSGSNQAMEQQMIHQIWQQMANSNGGSGQQQQQSLSGQNMGRNRTDYVPTAETPSTSNRFRGMKGLDQSQNQNQEAMVSSNNTSLNFGDSGFFSNGIDESMEYPWKA
ncbi:transcriptional regulator SLK2 [Hirschfeldia incana]|nr:transcriptional regulator SLK2 [Hirschfeldia incana]